MLIFLVFICIPFCLWVVSCFCHFGFVYNDISFVSFCMLKLLITLLLAANNDVDLLVLFPRRRCGRRVIYFCQKWVSSGGTCPQVGFVELLCM
jgi:hypothetical protein